jgi:hypothetical protein
LQLKSRCNLRTAFPYIENESVKYHKYPVDRKEFAQMKDGNRGTSCLLWPFVAIWNLVVWLVSLTGRLIAVLLGLVLIIAGVILTLTVVGAVIGIPLATFGVLLMVRGLW